MDNFLLIAARAIATFHVDTMLTAQGTRYGLQLIAFKVATENK